MGLDITAYEKLELIEGEVDLDDFESAVRIPEEHDFPGREGSLVSGAAYKTGAALTFYLSYGRYNLWRDRLAQLAGYPETPGEEDASRHARAAWQATEGPFWELIYFTDCDGVLGPEVCDKLAEDFADYRDKASAHENEDFRHYYDMFTAAFALARNGGMVRFH